MAKFSDYHGVLSVKDPQFGALGNGVHDDTTNIQACIDAAFGSRASPHSFAGRFSNRAVYFPPGDYITTAPLVLWDVNGGHIFGSSPGITRISFTGAFSGNDVTVSTGGADDITPVIITNGWNYSKMSGLTLSIADNNSAGLYIYHDNVVQAGPTGNTWSEMTFNGGTAGVLIGYQSPQLCSEETFINCFATEATYGYRNISQNALNNCFIGCTASQCDEGFSCPQGSIQIYCANTVANTVADITTGDNAMTIVGCRTESVNFVDTSASGGFPHVISGCTMTSGSAGFFCKTTTGNQVTIEGCHQTSSNSTSGIISGTAGTVYLRGNVFENASYLSSFTGTVGELDIPVGLVTALPTAATKYRGLRAVVTDANSTTFLATAAGSGANVVPVMCNGSAWVVG